MGGNELLTPISVEKFADMVIQNNEGYQRKNLMITKIMK